MDRFSPLTITECADANSDLGQIFVQPFHVNAIAFAIGQFAIYNTG